MPSNLHVISVKKPSPLRAPCEFVAVVTVENAGNDRADGASFDVTIDVSASLDGPIIDSFAAPVPNPEQARLAPLAQIDVPVTIHLPCAASIYLTITADKNGTVPNRDQMNPLPPLVEMVTPVLVPWLSASVRLGLRDGTGLVTMDVPSLCPGMTLVVEVTTENRGCTTSAPTQNAVRLEKASGGPVNTLLARRNYSVPAIAPNKSDVTRLDFALPGGKQAPATLTVRVAGDVLKTNPQQCGGSGFAAASSRSLESGGDPRLGLIAQYAQIKPGQVQSVQWSVENDCTELGLATLRFLYGPNAREIYRINKPIGPHGWAGNLLDLNLPLLMAAQIVNEFWSIGAKTLTLELRGAGGGRAFSTTVMFDVIPDAIDSSSWTWTSGTSFPWKRSYAVAGGFLNPSPRASFSLTGLSIVEHPTDVVGTGSDVTFTPVVAGRIAPLTSGTVSVPVIQTWTWTKDASTPTRRIFRYVANFTATDDFMNTYPGLVSAPLDVTVAVSTAKLIDRQVATALFAAGANLLAGGAVAAYWEPVIGIASMIAGMALLIAATNLLYSANDPPVPDFGSLSPLEPNVERWKLGNDDDPRVHPLRTLVLLCARFFRARGESLLARDRAWAAYIDRKEDACKESRDLARFHLETMRRCVGAITSAADESSSLWAEIAVKARKRAKTRRESTWDGTRVGMLRLVRSLAGELGLSERERALAEEAVGQIDETQIKSALDNFLKQGFTEIAPAISQLYDLTSSELAEAEPLHHE